MKTHEFTIIASGLDTTSDDFLDRLFESGCDDATVSFQKGVVILEFDREAPTFSNAIILAVQNVRAAGANVERVEPDHLVSLADIAKRAGLSRAAITNYHKGERASGFPAPVARVTSETSLWDWFEVSEWLHANGKLDRDEVVRARVVKEANLVFEAANAGALDNFTHRLEAAEREPVAA